MKVKIQLNRKILVVIGVAAPILLATAACLNRVSAQPGAELAGNSKRFKNIKVLKNLPADKLIPTMHEWNNSLGVKCDYCHTIGADHKGFDKDDKAPKNVARRMVTMVGNINKHEKAVGNKATCFLCHHGKASPETHAPAEGATR